MLAELKNFNPAFVDFTWGAGGSTSTLTFDLCKEAKETFGLNPNMHLTCTNMEISMIDTALDLCKQHGITNLVSLRGDPPVGQDRWTPKDSQLTCATDLVKYIRSKHGDYFCQSVGGYPEGHPAAMITLPLEALETLSDREKTRYSIEDNAINICRDDAFASELAYLKTKIDAGARAIITQMFFDIEVFTAFVSSCRQAGILVPIIPGIMCISTYGGFMRMVKFCKTRVPEEVGQTGWVQ
ncbi:hypothetical protein EON64_17280 [archaeon]|nr:MAG: hypothetical protein EON64_17280 [archaeon]